MSKKTKAGFCAYYLAHGGVGKTTDATSNWVEKKKKLLSDKSGDTLYVSCGPDRNKVIKERNKKMEKAKRTKKTNKSKHAHKRVRRSLRRRS